jgi:hypothetical protein
MTRSLTVEAASVQAEGLARWVSEAGLLRTAAWPIVAGHIVARRIAAGIILIAERRSVQLQ